MNSTLKTAVVVALLASIAIAVGFWSRTTAPGEATTAAAPALESAGQADGARAAGDFAAPTGGDDRALPLALGPSPALPRLLDLGMGKCQACMMMTPILQELATQYEGRMIVEYIDVAEVPEAGHLYGISMIPTQIFFDADGNELERHTGFIPKEDILAKWKALGYDFK